MPLYLICGIVLLDAPRRTERNERATARKRLYAAADFGDHPGVRPVRLLQACRAGARIDPVALGAGLRGIPDVVEQYDLACADEAPPMLMDEGRLRRIDEAELVPQATEPPQHGTGVSIDPRDFIQAAEGHEQVAVSVECERVAVRPVHRRTGAVGGRQIGNREMVERAPLEEQLARRTDVLDDGSGHLGVCDATVGAEIHGPRFITQNPV